MRLFLCTLSLAALLCGRQAAGAPDAAAPAPVQRRATPAPAQAHLAIGSVLPLSGAQAAYGAEATRGLAVALAMLAAADAELAGRVEIVAGDDESTAKGAAAAVERLVDKAHVQVVLGSVTSAATVAMAGPARARGIPMVAPITPQAAVAAEASVVRSCAGEAVQGAALAALARHQLSAKLAATLQPSGAAAPLADGFASAFTALGGQLPVRATFDLGAADFTPQLTQVLASGAKVLLAQVPYATAALLMQQARALDPGLKLLGGDGWDTPALNRAAGAAAAGHFFATHFAADDPDPAVAPFVAAYRQRYGHPPGALAAMAFDGANLIFDAFRRARTTLREPLTAELTHTRDLPGVTGALTYAGGGEPQKTVVVKETTADGATFKARVAPPAPAAPASPAAKGA